LPIFDCRLPIENDGLTTASTAIGFEIKNRQLAIGNQ
jgi:hypothetical protein